MDRDWRSEFEQNLELIHEVVRFVCRRRAFRGDEAEDFRSHVHLKLVDDNYAVLRKFQGRSRLRTYLVTVISNLGLDYLIAKRGKWRPSSQAVKLGRLAVRLEELVHRQGYSWREASLYLACDPKVGESAQAIEDLVAQLPQRTRRSFEGEERLAQLANPSAKPDRLLALQEQTEKRRQARRCLAQALTRLDWEDKLIVRLRFDKGLKIVHIARTLGVSQKPMYTRLKRILQNLRSSLEEMGLSGADIADLFESE